MLKAYRRAPLSVNPADDQLQTLIDRTGLPESIDAPRLRAEAQARKALANNPDGASQLLAGNTLNVPLYRPGGVVRSRKSRGGNEAGDCGGSVGVSKTRRPYR
jgi:hypothetical protein